MSVTIGPAEPIVPANDTVLLTNKTTSQFLGDEMGLALKSDVPTKTSELTNDSDFATNASVDEKIGGVTSSIPTKVSQLENDSNLISATKTVDGYYNIDTNKSYMAVADVMGRDFMTEYATKTDLDTVNRNLTTTVLDMQNELDTKATIEYVDSQIGQVLTQEVF